MGQRRAEVAGGRQHREGQDERPADETITGPGALAAPGGERRDQRADGDDDPEPQVQVERRAAVAARRPEQIAGGGRDRGGQRGDHQQREAGGEPRRAGPSSQREQFERARQQQERDREVDEQRVEAADESGRLGAHVAHASRSFTTWPCTSVRR